MHYFYLDSVTISIYGASFDLIMLFGCAGGGGGVGKGMAKGRKVVKFYSSRDCHKKRNGLKGTNKQYVNNT
jgi:hypothetical protein